MKKGIGAIEAQIDSVTAYRERESRRPRMGMSIQEERQMRIDEDREAVEAFRERQAQNPTGRYPVTCGHCGSAAMMYVDQDNQHLMETHSSGIYGSDVPCNGGW